MNFAESINAKFLTISAKKDFPEKFEDYLRELMKQYIKNGIQNDDNRISINDFDNTERKVNCCK